MTRRRPPVLLLVCLLGLALLPACGGQDGPVAGPTAPPPSLAPPGQPGDVPPPAIAPTGPTPGEPQPAAGGATPAPGGASGAAAAPTAPPADAVPAPPAGDGTPVATTAPGPAPVVPIDDTGPVGAACRDYLRPAIPRLVIEVDAQDGADLPSGVLDHLATSTAQVVDKPAGVEVDVTGRLDGGAREWTLEDLRATAAAARNTAQSSDTAVLHVLSVHGTPDPADERIAQSIGIAFGASAFVVFGDRIDSLAALIGGADAVLRAVTVHELGHLLCLVNISYSSEIAHEDPENPGHSTSRGSVMFHAIETTAIGQLFTGPPPTAFDADDLADLEGLRTGRY